jgi:hypothetical protein
MATVKYIQAKWGKPTRLIENPLISSVGTSATLILQNNPDRFHWLIINMSANTIYLAFDKDVSSTKGIILGGNGGYASMSADDDGESVCHEVWAVASGANSAVYAVETEAI